MTLKEAYEQLVRDMLAAPLHIANRDILFEPALNFSKNDSKILGSSLRLALRINNIESETGKGINKFIKDYAIAVSNLDQIKAAAALRSFQLEYEEHNLPTKDASSGDFYTLQEATFEALGEVDGLGE